MAKANLQTLVAEQKILNRIYVVRGQKIMPARPAGGLSSILNSKTAIQVNIRIIRVFTRLREYALTHTEILMQLARMEKEVKGNSRDIKNIFAVLKELIAQQSTPKPRNRIGFKQYEDEKE